MYFPIFLTNPTLFYRPLSGCTSTDLPDIRILRKMEYRLFSLAGYWLFVFFCSHTSTYVPICRRFLSAGRDLLANVNTSKLHIWPTYPVSGQATDSGHPTDSGYSKGWIIVIRPVNWCLTCSSQKIVGNHTYLVWVQDVGTVYHSYFFILKFQKYISL